MTDTIHWPTFADGLIWCACDNRTFDSEEAWQEHVVDSVTQARALEWIGTLRDVHAEALHRAVQPSESSRRQPALDS